MADSDALFAEFLGEIEATEKTIEDGQDGRSGTREGAGGALEESSKSAVGGDGGKRSGEAEGISDGPPPTAKKMRMTGKLVAAALPRKAAAPAAPRVPTPVTLAAPSSAERTGMGENTDKDVTSKSGVEGLGEGTQEGQSPPTSNPSAENTTSQASSSGGDATMDKGNSSLPIEIDSQERMGPGGVGRGGTAGGPMVAGMARGGVGGPAGGRMMGIGNGMEMDNAMGMSNGMGPVGNGMGRGMGTGMGQIPMGMGMGMGNGMGSMGMANGMGMGGYPSGFGMGPGQFQNMPGYSYGPGYGGGAAVNDGEGAAMAGQGEEGKKEKKEKSKFRRVGGGKTWEDETLAEWPENDYRLFVGDLGNEVGDDALAQAFRKYSSFAKAKVIREKWNKKSKGYGFVSFTDGMDMLKALREQNGKYLGNRPMKISKSTWKDRDAKEVKKKEKKAKKIKKQLGLLTGAGV